MFKFPSIAFIGGGNMANALVSGLLNQKCPSENLHVIEVADTLREQWSAKNISTSSTPDAGLTNKKVWIFAVKPQQMKEVVLACKPWLSSDTLVISIAAGISIGSLASWLGSDESPYQNVVRCMPNTPALVGAGVTGLAAPLGLSLQDRDTATNLLSAVGQTVWVEDDRAIDAVTALSGSGPAYVFLFIEALIQGGESLGLTAQQSKELALATLAGATKLASNSSEPPSTLRERVTSKGGTTAAALAVFQDSKFVHIVSEAMRAADLRAAELSKEFGA
ncbi:pyrroline-5-carboxylate reductase [Zwartia panacis]|uniref:pyrroline-5-carboxylate reductase n=1 Tax=Zwartia panacis TaxID=2683345 RepID=UPI0025B342EF|nr:pyrroline-5-carboxylate reductase [Zwartia panacis]MDN4016840.1 pyrroline-5-carboxylate reductase [Zwartia panacis]